MATHSSILAWKFHGWESLVGYSPWGHKELDTNEWLHFHFHTVKGFDIVNKAEIDVFLELSCFFNDPADVGNLISGPVHFLNPAWTSGSSQFRNCGSLAWRILSITLLVCEMSAIVRLFEHSLALPFFGIGMKIDFFQSCGHCWVFQICWHIECSTFTSSSFRIWNSSIARCILPQMRDNTASGDRYHHYQVNFPKAPFW